MGGLIRELVRPYRWTLVVVFLAMLMETAMSLAAPWPLKVILDNVVGSHHLPGWVVHSLGHLLVDTSKTRIAVFAAISAVLIAAIDAAAGYFDDYFTESLGQSVANDLRMRTYHHLQRLSLSYYDKHQVGTLLSTLTTDIETVEDFASSGVASIVIDGFTLVGMLGVMFWLNWQFALAVALVLPVLILFISRFKRMVKKATKQVRINEAEMVNIEGARPRVVQREPFRHLAGKDLEEARLATASHAQRSIRL